jgi:glycosyltransferase involved in cell wall biosynthesis
LAEGLNLSSHGKHEKNAEPSGSLEFVTVDNTRPIRILKFLSNFLIGGTERQFVHIANGLDPRRFAVDIACFRRQGPLLESLRADMPVNVYPTDGGFHTWRSIASHVGLVKDIRQRRYEIVHTYGWYPNVFAVPAARLALRPTVIASIRDAGAYMTPAKICALKFACRLADCILANSDAGKNWLLEQGVNERKIEVIRNGIVMPNQCLQREDFSAVRKEFSIPQGAPVCACIGRLVSGKGIDFYLRAARILADRRRDVRFLMIGAHSSERGYQSDMEVLARQLNIQNQVIFTGQRQDVSEILRDVDLVVHPSLTEGLSNVILEAMAAGIPVVATRVGGNPELVQDGRTGFLVPPQNAEAIADAICRLLDQPEMARGFGEAARQRVIQEFSIERMLSKTENLYFRLLEKRRAWRATTHPEMPASPAGRVTPQ